MAAGQAEETPNLFLFVVIAVGVALVMTMPVDRVMGVHRTRRAVPFETGGSFLHRPHQNQTSRPRQGAGWSLVIFNFGSLRSGSLRSPPLREPKLKCPRPSRSRNHSEEYPWAASEHPRKNWTLTHTRYTGQARLVTRLPTFPSRRGETILSAVSPNCVRSRT